MTLTRCLSIREAIETRRSIRAYQPTVVPQEDVQEVLRLTRLAPSAWNTQPWRFVVVRRHEVRGQLCDAAYGQRQVAQAPTVIVVYSDMEDVRADETAHPAFGEDGAEKQARVVAHFAAMPAEARAAWGHAQTHIALGFLVLAARGLGYDTNPIVAFDAARVKALLALPEQARIAALVPLGERAEDGQAHYRLSVERLTRWVK